MISHGVAIVSNFSNVIIFDSKIERANDHRNGTNVGLIVSYDVRFPCHVDVTSLFHFAMIDYKCFSNQLGYFS
jgi:hypothetical protein